MLTVVGVLSYVNDRFIKLPTAVGLMGISLALSLGFVALEKNGIDIAGPARRLLVQVDFSETLMHGLLSFLLFAGAVQFRIKDLAQQKYVILLLATVGVAASTFVTGSILFYIFKFLHIQLSYIYCLIFGALISPTDPVAVLALLKNSRIPKSLEVKISGESLFNDGVAVVLFVLLLGFASKGSLTMSVDDIAMLLMRQIVGGALFGLLMGWITYLLLAKVEQYSVEVIISLACACGVYAVASRWNLSAPIAVVISALVIGNQNRSNVAKSARAQLESFWELVDELLNSVLFVWIGLAVLAFTFTRPELIAGLIAIPVVLVGRFLSIWLAVSIFGFKHEFTASTYWLMTWGGLRGGISVALVLSIPFSTTQDLLLSMTYVVVVFSILFQGLTIGLFAKRPR